MNRGIDSPKNEHGFSLLELLVALLILSIVALGIAGLFSHAQITNASGFDYAKLASEARDTVESLQSLPFNDAMLLDTAGTPRTWTQSNRGFDVLYTVQDFDVSNWVEAQTGSAAWPVPASAADTNIKRITVRVRSTRALGLTTGRREFVTSSLRIPG
jgi:prepilin-type N-terminal cleavage/methylation domain-containing protein